jgi:ABC-type uncharacterized transport system substrate-binding protein
MTYTWTGGARAAEPPVWIALSDAGGAYAEAAAAIRAEIERAGSGQGQTVVRPWREFSAAAPAPRLIVAVGSQALRGIAEGGPKVPLLAVLVPAASYERSGAGAGGRTHSAVLIEQPPTRQLAALRLALPDRPRVGVPFGPTSRSHEPAFRSAAAAAGMQLVAGRVDGPDALGTVLQRLLEDSDLLLALADPDVFNSASIQNVLTAAYRRRVPLVAFSPAYVRAGALLALYSTPAQFGRQAGEIARAFLAGRPLPPAQPPRDFVVGINGEVARSLGLALRPEDGVELAAQIRMREGPP